MIQTTDFVNVSQKIEDKIGMLEMKNRKKMTDRERAIAEEMFLSGMMFGIQYNGGKE